MYSVGSDFDVKKPKGPDGASSLVIYHQNCKPYMFESDKNLWRYHGGAVHKYMLQSDPVLEMNLEALASNYALITASNNIVEKTILLKFILPNPGPGPHNLPSTPDTGIGALGWTLIIVGILVGLLAVVCVIRKYKSRKI